MPAAQQAAAVYASWEEPSAPQPEENLFAMAPAGQTPAPAGSAAPEAADFAIRLIRAETAVPRRRVLIYHTHTYEAYAQTAQEPYEETEKWRTADSAHNVVRVGEELAALLRGLGIDAVHDVTAFEPPALSSAYARSLQMLEKRLAAGERYDLYIDLHRDAYVESQTGPNTVNVGGVEVAKLMLLIGKGEGQTAEGFDRRPDWEANLNIAQAMTDCLNDQSEGLCRDVRVKSGRFNQHVATGCVLVEAGNNRNTLAEALAAMPYLADAVAQALLPEE